MTMLHKKPLKAHAVKKRVRFDRFSLSPADDGALGATSSKNCECLRGVLQSGIGAEPVIERMFGGTITSDGLPDGCTFVALVASDDWNPCYEKYAAMGSGRLYVYEPEDFAWCRDSLLYDPVRAFRVVDKDKNLRTAFLSGYGIELLTFGRSFEKTQISRGTEYTHMGCYQQGRIFYTTGLYSIGYSAPYDPSDYTEDIHGAGTLTVPSDYGKIIDLVAFQSNVCVICEYGFYVVEPAGSASEFKLKTFPSNFGKILNSSIGVCGIGKEKMMFLTEQGACAFDGANVYGVGKNLNLAARDMGMFSNCASFDGKYLVKFINQIGEEQGVVIDAETGDGYYCFLPTSFSNYGQRGALCTFDGSVRELHRYGAIPSTEKRYFEVHNLEFGYMGKKNLEDLEFEGEGGMKVIVKSGKTEKSFTCTFGQGLAKVKLNMPGEKYSVRLELNDQTKVYAMTADVKQLHCVK